MDPAIEAAAYKARHIARLHLDRQLIDWRKELWPDRSKDPIWRAEHEARVRRRMGKLNPLHAAVADRFGAFSMLP